MCITYFIPNDESLFHSNTGWYKYKSSENVPNFLKATGMPASMVEMVKTNRTGFSKAGDSWILTDCFGGLEAKNKFKFDEEFTYEFPGTKFTLRDFLSNILTVSFSSLVFPRI